MFRHSHTLHEDPNEQLIEKEADVLLEVELSDCLYNQIIHLFSLSRRQTRFTSLELLVFISFTVYLSRMFPGRDVTVVTLTVSLLKYLI